ncbi:MAG: hypothetical protein AB2799_14750 [Candidatus Thiodiazotropha sp.]
MDFKTFDERSPEAREKDAVAWQKQETELGLGFGYGLFRDWATVET